MDLICFVQSGTCYLLNQGKQTIRELIFNKNFLGFEDGLVVGNDYAHYKLRNFEPKTFIKIYEMTAEDIVYLPSTQWFELDIQRCITADGVEHKPLILNSVKKFGGYKPAATLVDLPLKMVPNAECKGPS